MSGEFDALLDEEEGRLTRDSRGSTSPFEAELDAEAQQREARLHASLRQALTVKPDTAAKHSALSTLTGVPAPVIERNEDIVATQARLRELRDLAAKSPVLARQLADPEFAKLAHDDAEGLGAVEQAFGFVKKGGAAVGSALPSVNAKLWGWAEASADVVSKYMTGPLAGTLLPQDPAAIAAERFRAYRRDQSAFAKDIRRNEAGAGFVESNIYGGLASFGENALFLPLALASGNPQLALVPMAGSTGGGAYGQAKDAGKPLMDALAFATSQAVVEYATEKLPVSRLLGDLKTGTPFFKLVMRQAAAEIPGEQIATVLQDLNEWAALKPNAPFSEYLAERPSAAAATLISTIVSVGGQTTVAKGIEMAANRLGAGLERAGEAERAQQFFLQMQQLATESKLRERAPDSFGAFIQEAAGDGPVTDVYVSGRELAAVLEQSPNVPVPPSVQEQISEAVATGGDLRIPIGEYTAHLAASDAGTALLQHLKTSPDAMSFAEAQVFNQEQAGQFKAQAEQILAEQQATLDYQNNANVVRDHFAQELATANRFTPEVNAAYATLMRDFYTTMAQRLGITPVEMLARYPLRVAAENVAGELVLDQSGEGTRIRGKDGSPLLVHRGAANPLSQRSFGEDQFGGSTGNSSAALGVWFTPSRSEAAGYGNVESFHLNIRNPAVYKVEDLPGFDSPEDARKFREALQRKGHDGIVISAKHLGGGAHIVAFSPEQVVRPDQSVLEQSARGQIALGTDITKIPSVIGLLKNADLSTFLHESGHFYLEVLAHIASQPGAPADVMDDMKAVLKWFHVKDLETWQKMPLEARRAHHEKFARGFEAYLFEGKAPSTELQSLFARFRSWLINVYKSLTELRVDLSDEVRSVFDRMLASEEQIASSDALRAMVPAFNSQEEAKATTAEWQSYQSLGREQVEDAVRSLERRSLNDMKWASSARSKYLKALQAEADEKRKAIRKEVEPEVANEPIYRALRFLTKGEIDTGEEEIKALKGFKLDRAAVESLLVARGMDPKLLADTDLERLTIKEGGLEPGTVAEMFGFASGDELAFKLLGMEKQESVVQGLTDQRMLERHGDLVDDRAVAQAADEAVHNEARARFVATELRFLERVASATQPTGRLDKRGRPISANILAKAAKQFAEQIVARKKVKDIRPAQYAAAEGRAAKAAAAATNPLEKATEKRNQLVNLHATRAAHGAVAEIEKGIRYLKRFDKDSGSIDVEYLDQIHQLLERFDVRQATRKEVEKRAALRDWVEEQRDLGFEPTIDKALLAEAQRQHYSTMTLEEFRGLVDAVKNIEHLGRLKKKLLTAKDERELKERIAEAVQSIHDNATGTVPERKSSDRGPLVPLGRLFRGFNAVHRKFSSLSREMDGFKDGGVMWELFSRTMNEAGDKEASMREAATVALGKLFKPILTGEKFGNKRDFSDVFGKSVSLTREERIGVALNTGNEVNRERVLTGQRWSPSQLERVLDSLTKEEWDFVQSVWDYLESYRPQIAEKTRRITGTEPEWVEPRPVMTKHGNYRGGYYPIKYDPLVDSRSEADDAASIQRQMERGLYVRAQTRRGHLEARTESTGRRLRFDLGVVMSHVDQVIHDLSWHEWLIDANRLLGAKSLDGAIREHYGPEKLAQLKNALKDIAIGEIPAQDSWEKAINHLRHGATIVGLGYNVVTSLLQPFGLTQSMVRIGPAHVVRGLARWIGDPEKGTEWIYERSEMMRLRGKTMQREINEIRNQVANRSSAVESSYFFLIQTMQKVADIPTWLGQYEKAMAQEGMTEGKAIALADQAVLDAQGGGQIKDLAGVQKGAPFKKLWTNFYSFFNVTYNLAVERTKATKFTDPLSVGKLGVDYLLLMVVPSVLGTLLKEAFKWGAGDEDDLARKLVRDQINYVFGLMVGLREMSAAVSGFAGYSGPGGTRFFTELGKLVKQVSQGEVDEAAVKAAANTAGVILHLPTGQVVRTVDGIHALVTGKTENPGALLVGSDKN